MPTSTNAIEALIASHRAAVVAIDRLRDDVDEGELTTAVFTKTATMQALVEAPCDDEAFFAKLAYLLADKIRTDGRPDIDNGFGALAIAVSAWLSERGL